MNVFISQVCQFDLGVWCLWQHHNCFTLAIYIAYTTIVNYLPFHFTVPSAAPISKNDSPSNTINHTPTDHPPVYTQEQHQPCTEPPLTRNVKDEISQEEMMELLFPNANPNLLEFLRMQSKCCQAEVEGKDPRSRRWSPAVISTSLSLWVASPVAYRILGNTFHLPTERILQMYKNCIDKDPGVNTPLIHWMSKECERTGTAKEGGIIFDEMAIQAGVQFQPCGEGLKMYGYVECGPYNNGMQDKGNKDTDMPLATYVLQFVFLLTTLLDFLSHTCLHGIWMLIDWLEFSGILWLRWN